MPVEVFFIHGIIFSEIGQVFASEIEARQMIREPGMEEFMLESRNNRTPQTTFLGLMVSI